MICMMVRIEFTGFYADYIRVSTEMFLEFGACLAA